uniref:U1 small nuclear ribonucleoprotein 70 kDa n=1 Tax=Anopheles coluzzii TaxID=1518534 RepID=A0A8W7PHW4_ANOCL
MTQYLPPNLLALFAPRDPIPYLPPPDKLPHEKKSQGYLGVGAFLDCFEDPKDTPPPTRVETREERVERRRRERAEQVAYKLEREIATWDPNQLLEATEDPFKTLFVARINYDTSESKLRREFEIYGNIKKIIMINDKDTGKPRGYAFIEYEHERDMHDYPDYSAQYSQYQSQVKYEDGEEEKYRPNEPPPHLRADNGRGYVTGNGDDDDGDYDDGQGY